MLIQGLAAGMLPSIEDCSYALLHWVITFSTGSFKERKLQHTVVIAQMYNLSSEYVNVKVEHGGREVCRDTFTGNVALTLAPVFCVLRSVDIVELANVYHDCHKGSGCVLDSSNKAFRDEGTSSTETRNRITHNASGHNRYLFNCYVVKSRVKNAVFLDPNFVASKKLHSIDFKLIKI
jgi:hypothetical protein